MGTHAVVRFVSAKSGQALVSFYFQYDGYPKGVGLSLVRFLKSRQLVNGIPLRRPENSLVYANGIGCLAAQFCQHCKSGPGGFYIVDNESIEEYTYIVIVDETKFSISIFYEPEGSRMTLDEFEEFASRS